MHHRGRITPLTPRHGMLRPMTRTARLTQEFGPRLRRLRQERGWTLAQLAEKIDGTVRAIFYYEQEGRFPPAPVVAKLAEAFDVSMEFLMAGEEPARGHRSGEAGPNLLQNADDRRLWRRFAQLKSLNERDQAAVLRMLGALIAQKEAEN